MTISTISDATSLLSKRLRGMAPTGTSGFEGLMRDVLDEVTGQRFYLAKSGHQDGSDLRADPANAFRIGLEGKRYGATTRLSLDQLKGKIVDAAGANDPVDLWLLAATREIPITDREELVVEGIRHGISVLVLDWPEREDQLADLAVLCAIAPTAMDSHFKDDEELKAALALIEKAAEFPARKEYMVSRLTQADVGYEAARRQVDRWLARSQESLTNARSRLRGYHNLRDPSQKIVSRSAIFAKLDKWWSKEPALIALLGEEGNGKTWTALSWRNARHQGGDPLPLTVFLNAKDVFSSDPYKVLAWALGKQTDLPDEEFWLRRLRLWERAPSEAVRILIILDGLNENVTFDGWADFLQPLFESERVGMYAVLITCWPTSWQRLERLAPITPKPQELSVPLFNDEELDALLEQHGLERSSFARNVLELMRVPRLSPLAIEQRNELASQGEVTPERLILEDWKNRIDRKGAVKGLSDAEMREFVGELGKKISADLKGDLSRKDIVDALAKDSGFGSETLEAAVEALASGRWLQTTGNPNRFTVDKQKVPFALGVTLVADLKKCADNSVIEGRVAEFLEPLKAHSIGTAILRAAVIIALLDPQVSHKVRKLLLRTWLSEANFSNTDFRVFWGSAGLDIEVYLDTAEDVWMDDEKYGGHVDEILIKGLSAAHQYPVPAKAIESRVVAWLGWLWPDPEEGQFLGKHDPSTEDAVKRASETRLRFSKWQKGPLASDWPPVKLQEGRDVSWMSHRSVAMLSYMPRVPFVEAIMAWGLSRALMQRARHYDELAWVLRLNDEDENEARELIEKRISDLRATDSEVCEKAAEWIEHALCTVKRVSGKELIDTEERRKAENGFLAGETNSLGPVEFPDPDGMPLLEVSHALLELFRRGDRKYGDAPSELINRINKATMRVADEDQKATARLLDHMGKLWLILTAEAKTAVVVSLRRAEETFPGSDDKAEQQRKVFGYQATMFELQGMDEKQQAEFVRDYEVSYFFGEENSRFLRLLSKETFESLAPKLPQENTVEKLRSWLSYLAFVLKGGTLEQWDELQHLVVHDDDQVRLWAMRLAFGHRNVAAAKVYASSDFAKGEVEDREARFCHRHLLLMACGYSPDEDCLALLGSEAIALACAERPNDAAILSAFNTYLEEQFGRAVSGGNRSYPAYWYDHQDAVDALVKTRPNDVERWLVPFLQVHEKFDPFTRMDRFPVVSTMKAMATVRPALAETILERLNASDDARLVNPDGLRTAAFFWPTGEPGDRLRRAAVESAYNDEMLLLIANAAARHSHLDWMAEYIEQAAAAAEPSRIARAYTLLGFCDGNEKFDALWDRLDQKPPADLWLQDVRRISRFAYDRNKMAKTKVKQFWEAESEMEAFLEMREAINILDVRGVLWMKPLYEEVEVRDPLRVQHRSFITDDMNREIKKKSDGYKRTLFHTRVPGHTMAPWS